MLINPFTQQRAHADPALIDYAVDCRLHGSCETDGDFSGQFSQILDGLK